MIRRDCSACSCCCDSHQVPIDPDQIKHRFSGAAIGVTEMLRCAKDLKLKARAVALGRQQLAKMPLPAIAELKDGSFLILGRATADDVLVQIPSVGRPQKLERAEFLEKWTGRIVMMARRASLADLARRFDVTWFLQAMHKYRRLLGEVLVASFFLQLFALVTPLFFQVVTDKVLTHRGYTTLDVLVIGLITVSIFESVLGRAAHLRVLAHHQPHRRRTRHAAVPTPDRAADRLLRSAAGRRFRGAGARTGKHPQFPHQFGPDAAHRSLLHLRASWR